MAEGRFLRKKISQSERVEKLPLPAQLLYSWMLGHLDAEGRYSGNPKVVKNKVFTLKNYSFTLIDKWLDKMDVLKDDTTGYGLIERYKVNGNQYLWYPGFAGEQNPQGGNSWKRNEAPYYRTENNSDIPPPPTAPVETPAQKPKKKPAKVTVDKDDLVLGQMATDYEENIGALTPMLYEKLKLIQEEYPEGWFDKAVKEAVASNVRKLTYIEGILKRWKTEGIDSKKESPEGDRGGYNFDT